MNQMEDTDRQKNKGKLDKVKKMALREQKRGHHKEKKMS